MKIKIILSLIIGIIIIGAVFIFLTSQGKSLTPKIFPPKKQVLMTDQSREIKSGTTIDIDTSDSDSKLKTSQISTGPEYANMILSVRKPINKNIEEIVKKMKYDKIFSQTDILKIVTDTKTMINEQIDYLTNLELDPKFSQVNQAHIQSLTLLKESLENLEQLYVTKDTLYFQTYSLKIEQSNDLIQNLQIPN